jgi:hypothetical protein
VSIGSIKAIFPETQAYRAITLTTFRHDHPEILPAPATLACRPLPLMPFPQPIHASRLIDTQLRLHNAATLVERESFLESAEQAELRRSAVRQQRRGSRRQFFFQLRQDLLNDHRIFDAGNHLGCTTASTARLQLSRAYSHSCMLTALRPLSFC